MSGADGWDRTSDTRRMKPLLYRLSYISEERTAMRRSRNHFGQLGRLAVCDQRSGSAWVHGGEHGSGFLGLQSRGTLAADEFGPHDVPIVGAQRPAVHFVVFAKKPAGLPLKMRSKQVAALPVAIANIAKLPDTSAAGFS